MKSFSLKTLSLVAASLVLSMGAFSSYAGGSCSSSSVYRTYFVDSQCRIYYRDAEGNKVMENNYKTSDYSYLPLKQDCNGRWYYQDSMGTKIYMVKRCG